MPNNNYNNTPWTHPANIEYNNILFYYTYSKHKCNKIGKSVFGVGIATPCDAALNLASHGVAFARELRPQSLLQFWLLLVFFFIFSPNNLLYMFSYLHV